MPLLFLSHSGVDTDAARSLKVRLLGAVPGLDVWFDKDDLKGGEPWQRQIESALARSTAFAVYVGSRGVLNWVEAEVSLALDRAVTEPGYCFLPILATGSPGVQALPAFARQYQGVVETEFEKIVAALLGTREAGTPTIETEPFFGLRAIDENRSHLFFGREAETDELVRRIYEQPLVLLSGDSGSGKSSLVRAGLIPRFRGGALSALRGERPNDRIWHVVTTRPRVRPWAELSDAVGEAAKALGLSIADCEVLAMAAQSGDPDQVRRALRCGLPAEHTVVLLVVDQFEELFTTTPQEERQDFARLLLALSDDADERLRVVLTMRHDYVNLCSTIDGLRERLDSSDRRARMILDRTTDAGLERIVTEPLRLAGITETNRRLLARVVREEVGTRPGDLALVQMALTETWHARVEHDGNLLAAYAAVGRVEGAIARAAEHFRVHELQTAANRSLASLLDTVLVRLVRLGDTGGATRRQATRDEFDDEQWRLVQLLAGDQGKRLVQVSGTGDSSTAEIAHEALVTAWPHYQSLLQTVADDKRVLDALIPKAKSWRSASLAQRRGLLAGGPELEWFARLASHRPEWLSTNERQFITASDAELARARHNVTLLRTASWVAAAVFGLLFAITGWQFVRVRDALKDANASTARALWERLPFYTGDSLDDRQLNTLWEIARAERGVRDAFLNELNSNAERAEQLASYPEPILRALYLRWPQKEGSWAFAALVRAIASGRTGGHVLRAVESISRGLDATPAKGAADLVVAAATGISKGDVRLDTYEALAHALRGLEVNLSSEQAAAMLAPVWTVRTQSLGDLERLGEAGAAVIEKLDEQQAQTIFELVSKRVTQDQFEARMLFRLLAPLSLKAPAENALSNLWALVDVIAAPGLTERVESDDVAQAMFASAAKLNEVQARSTFSTIVDRLQKKDGSPRGLAVAAGALAKGATPDQRQRALPILLNAFESRLEGFDSAILANAVQALAPELTSEQVVSTLQFIEPRAGTYDLSSQSRTGVDRPSRWARRRLVGAMAALSERLHSEHVEVAFGLVLRVLIGTMVRDSDYDSEEVLQRLLRTVVSKATPVQKQSLFADLLKFNKVTDNDVASARALALHLLADAQPSAQARAGLSSVMSVVEGWGSDEEVEKAIAALVNRMDANDAEASLAAILKAQTATTAPDALHAHRVAMRALAPFASQMTGELLNARVLRDFARTTKAAELSTLAPILGASTIPLTNQQSQAALAHIETLITTATSEAGRTPFVIALAGLAGQLTNAQALAALALVFQAPIMENWTDDFQSAITALTNRLTSVEQNRAAYGLVLEAMSRESGDEQLTMLQAVLLSIEQKLPSADSGERLTQRLRAATASASPAQIRALIWPLSDPAGSVTSEQAEPLMQHLLKDFPYSETPKSAVREGYVSPFALVSGMLTPTAREQAENRMSEKLAWAKTPVEATAAAMALVALTIPEAPTTAATRLVEALKYPMAVGEAEDVILKRLSVIYEVPPSDQSRNSILKRVESKGIRLDARPACPPPAEPSRSCTAE